MKGSFGVDELVSFCLDAGAVLLIFGDFKAIIGVIGSDYSFGGFMFGVSFDAFFIAIFEILQILELGLFGKGRQFLKGVPLWLLLHVTNYFQMIL